MLVALHCALHDPFDFRLKSIFLINQKRRTQDFPMFCVYV